MIISPPEKTYKQSLTLRIAAAIVPVLAWFFVWLAWSDNVKPPTWLLGTALGLTALWIWMCLTVAKSQLTIHSEGLQRTTAFGITEMMWQDIMETRFTQVDPRQAAAIHFGLIGLLFEAAGRGAMGSNNTGSGPKTLTLHAHDGRKMKITPNWLDSDDAIGTILQRVNPSITEDLRRRIREGQTVKFGDLSLSQQGIGWKNKEPIPAQRVAKCEINGTYLRIKAEGKWLDNVAVATQKVPNIFVFLELVDELRTGGKPALTYPLLRA